MLNQHSQEFSIPPLGLLVFQVSLSGNGFCIGLSSMGQGTLRLIKGFLVAQQIIIRKGFSPIFGVAKKGEIGYISS